MTTKKYNVTETYSTELGRFRIVLDNVSEHNNVFPYSYIDMKASVGVLPLVRNKILLIRQYRHALGTYEIEIPGGGVDNNEHPEETARRELLEETGYEADELFSLGTYFPSPGSSNEITYLYGAKCHFSKAPKREPLEFIEQFLVDKDEFVKLILNGTFRHSMGLVAWLKFVFLCKGSI